MTNDTFQDVNEVRSRNMAAIKAKDTKPEMVVRRLVRSLGIGYRLHRKDIPGKPDLAFIGRKKAIFVHGCFWHQHEDPNCPLRHTPKSRLSYWQPKLQRNKERDTKALQALNADDWDVLIIWECETKDIESLTKAIRDFLTPPTA